MLCPFTLASVTPRKWNDLKGYEFAGGTNEIMDYIAGRQLVKKYKNK